MITDDELGRLEALVTSALATGDAASLRVLGYGEISMVLGWPIDAPRWACKRLPPFASAAAAAAYASTVDDYLEVLGSRGVQVVDTEMRTVPAVGGGVVLYCVQPVLPAGQLGVAVVRAGGPDATAVLRGIIDVALEVVDERVGLDAQLSNWALVDGTLQYFDVTTPLLRRADGTEMLDTRLLLSSLPWLLRGPVHRFVVPDILERYHQPHDVVLDLAANLVKERLDQHIDVVLDAAAGRVEPGLTEQAVRADYRSDARTWGLLQAARRADRWWQRRVRRRTYAFLLPPKIER